MAHKVAKRSQTGSAKLNYLTDLEILTALVTHLAMTDWWHRTPKNLATALSIPESDIARVLETYKGLFRKSPNLSKPGKKPLYTLQLRYAQQWMERDAEDEIAKAPLEPQYLVALLDFVARRADEETRRGYTVKAAWIAAAVAVLASIANIVVTLVTRAPSSMYLL